MSAVMTPPGVPTMAPLGEESCERIKGRPIVSFELARHDLSHPGSIIDRLFDASRERWKEVEADPEQEMLFRASGADWFQFVAWNRRRGANSAIRVRRVGSAEMWSHGHILRARTVNCSLHHYVVSVEQDRGRIRERVEIRSTSSLLTFYRHRMERDAIVAASRQLDELVRDLRSA